jgi:hypothetical protein
MMSSKRNTNKIWRWTDVFISLWQKYSWIYET